MPAELTADQLELVAYLKKKAAETAAWVAEDPTNRWACSAVADADHWASYGVFSVAQYEHQMSCELAYDLHKDRYGFKPNYAELKSMTLEELDSYIERLSAEPTRDW